WIPFHVSDLDKCQHLLLKFQPELQTDHPGFRDEAYRKRRQDIAQLAFDYHQLCPLLTLSYEILLDYTETSGFRLRPVAGLVSPRDFLANFAFRVFPCTQYIRHHSRPAHTPEPDMIHEFLGHVPLLTNRKFADFAQRLGLASLGASDDFVNKLTTLFWFTIEFGLCLEEDQLRAVGAGLLSSFGELEHAFSDESEKRPLEPNTTAIQPYDDVGYQPVYFVCQSFELMEKQLK
ncbi:Phenylalanine hydroxylase, partial [Paragonimus heterotremus]